MSLYKNFTTGNIFDETFTHHLKYTSNRFYVTAGDPSLEAGCDTKCLEKAVCDIVKTVATDDCSRLPFKN